MKQVDISQTPYKCFLLNQETNEVLAMINEKTDSVGFVIMQNYQGKLVEIEGSLQYEAKKYMVPYTATYDSQEAFAHMMRKK